MLSPHETDVVRRDPKLPGLATVLDAAAFVSTLAAAVSCDVDAARIRYVRYKPGRRGMVLYDVQSGEDNFEVVATALSADGWRKYLATADLPESACRNLSAPATGTACWLSNGCQDDCWLTC